MEKIKINCIKEDYLVCPVCGSRELVGTDKETGHCGQCGVNITVEIVGKVMDNESAQEEFSQMSLF